MSTPTDHSRPLPETVVARCAASDPDFYQAHGATSSGVNDLASSNLTESLAELAMDMRVTRQRWLARERWEGVR